MTPCYEISDLPDLRRNIEGVDVVAYIPCNPSGDGGTFPVEQITNEDETVSYVFRIPVRRERKFLTFPNHPYQSLVRIGSTTSYVIPCLNLYMPNPNGDCDGYCLTTVPENVGSLTEITSLDDFQYSDQLYIPLRKRGTTYSVFDNPQACPAEVRVAPPDQQGSKEYGDILNRHYEVQMEIAVDP